MRPSCLPNVLTILLGLMLSANESPAGDWPQILGPQRNGSAEGEKFPTDCRPSFGPNGPRRLVPDMPGRWLSAGK